MLDFAEAVFPEPIEDFSPRPLKRRRVTGQDNDLTVTTSINYRPTLPVSLTPLTDRILGITSPDCDGYSSGSESPVTHSPVFSPWALKSRCNRLSWFTIVFLLTINFWSTIQFCLTFLKSVITYPFLNRFSSFNFVLWARDYAEQNLYKYPTLRTWNKWASWTQEILFEKLLDDSKSVLVKLSYLTSLDTIGTKNIIRTKSIEVELERSLITSIIGLRSYGCSVLYLVLRIPLYKLASTAGNSWRKNRVHSISLYTSNLTPKPLFFNW